MDAPDVVEFQCSSRRDRQIIQIEDALDARHEGPDGAGAVLDQNPVAHMQRTLRQPGDMRAYLAHEIRDVVGPGDDVAAGDVDVVGQLQGHGLPDPSDLQRAISQVDAGHGGVLARRQDDDLVAHTHSSGADPPRVAAVVGQAVSGRALGADDQLDGQAESVVGPRGARRQGF